MKLLKNISLGAVSIAMSFGIVAIAQSTRNSSFVKGETTNYSLNLSSSNRVTSSGDHVMTSQTGGQVTFTYDNVSSSTSGHVTLNSTGSLKNKDVIHSITAFTAIYTGSIKVRTSYDANTWSSYFDIVSAREYQLGSNPYYIEFSAVNGAATFTNVNIKYSCLVNEDIPTGSASYEKVTNVSDLVVGSKVVITNTEAEYALSTTQNNNNRSAVEITSSQDKKTININEDVAELTLCSGSQTGTYAFYTGSGYLYAASSTSNYLRTETSLSDNSTFKIEYSSGTPTVTAQGLNSRNLLQFNPNNGSPIFSCYSNAQQDVTIYQCANAISAPNDEIGFIATDSKATTYKTSDTYADNNSLSVKALFTDGTQKDLTSGEYTLQMKNSGGEVVNMNKPFKYAGTYTLTVSYKSYISQNITLTVSGSTFTPIVDVAMDNIDGTFTTSDKFSDFISTNDWGTTVLYEDEEMDQIDYADFQDNNLTFALTNPSGITHDVNSPFGLEGEWKVRVSYSINSSVYDETTFNVSIVPVTTITLDHSSETIFVDDTIQLAVSSINPTDATHKEVTWSSTNSNVASVNNNGLVTGVSKGSCTIRATATDGSAVYGECAITVKENTTTKYMFSSKDWKATPADWSSGKAGGGYLNNGVQITEGASGANATSPISFTNVSKVIVTYCTNSKNGAGNIKITVGSTDIATKSVSSSGGTTARELEFVPSSPLTGKVKITVTCSTNSIYICACEIQTGEAVYPTSVALSATKTNIGVGETTTISATPTPSNASLNNETWSSSDSSVATVSNNGIVTGVKAGTATITYSVDGETAKVTNTISITVSNIAVTGVNVTPTTETISVNETLTLSATISPSNATNKNVTFSSADDDVATVNSSGLVTGVAPGIVNITVTTQDGGFTATASITVTEKEALAKTHIEQYYKDLCSNGWYDCDCTPTTAKPKILIIPVWFSNSSAYISASKKDTVRDDIRKAYLGTNDETGWRSVKTYYEELSNGATSLTGTVSEWYEITKSSYEITTTQKTSTLVTEATNWYFANHSDSRTNYDTDRNGYLDGVILIYGAPDHSALEGNDNLWAYCFWTQLRNKNISNPQVNPFFWASYDFMYNSTKAKTQTGSEYGSGDTSHCSIDAHTFIHEMGHMFGIDDYYDYSYDYKPAGAFSMQDYNVGCHDPYSVMAWGWADPYIPTESCEIELHPFQSSRELILLTPSWNSYNSPFDEYLLLELFTPTGLNKFDCDNKYYGSPQGPNAVGIRLWHVDSRLGYEKDDGYVYFWTTNAKYSSNVGLGLSNTYATADDGGSLFADSNTSDYYYFNLLQLIRNNTSETYKPTSNLSSSSLFTNGSSFTMSKYASQFRINGKLNQGVNLGWSFSVSITGSGANAVATVTCTKS